MRGISRRIMRMRADWLYALISFALLASAVVYAGTRAENGNFLEVASRYSIGPLILIVAALVLGTLLGALRLQALAHDFGYPLGFGISVRTVALSQTAATLFFQLYGQLASRGAILQRQGMPVATAVLITLIERLVAMVILMALAGAGAVIVFGGMHLDARTGGAELLELMCGLIVGCGAAFIVWQGISGAREHLRNIDGATVSRCVFRTVLLTGAIQITTLVAFTTSAFVLAPEANLYMVAAASTVVMLASALPISFGGWGVRELSAVVVLGAVVVPPEAAFISALTVGVLSLAVVIVLGGASLVPNLEEDASKAAAKRSLDAFPLLAWTLPLLVAVLVFFQVYLPVGSGNLNTCLADPLILIGVGLFLLSLRGQAMAWRIPHLGIYVTICTAVMFFGLVYGWMSFGSNTWAYTKAFGWLVLVAYALTAALIVRVGGEDGFETLLKTLVATFLGIAAFEYAASFAFDIGLNLPLPHRDRVDGFAQDPNAFAFQIVLVMAIVLSLPETALRPTLPIAACFTLMWLTGSRSGAVTGGVALAAALYLRPQALRPVLSAACIALLAVLTPLAIHWLLTSLDLPVSLPKHDTIFRERLISNDERLRTITGGLSMFMNSPLWGKGLGYFVQNYFKNDGSRLIIHSSHLWLLAEFGILGFAAFAAPGFVILRREWSTRTTDWVSRMVLIILVAFATMSLVHDMIYQRLLWFILGGVLALSPIVARRGAIPTSA
jgi:hypothetical protein